MSWNRRRLIPPWIRVDRAGPQTRQRGGQRYGAASCAWGGLRAAPSQLAMRSKIEAALNAIEAVFSDASVPAEQTRIALEGLLEAIEDRLNTL